MTAVDTIRAYHDELTAIRRDIHAHPEIGFEEHRTSDLVAAKLAEWGIEVHRGVGGTGVVGVLRRGNGAASIGLRADMDALPIHEVTGKPYASIHAGIRLADPSPDGMPLRGVRVGSGSFLPPENCGGQKWPVCCER